MPKSQKSSGFTLIEIMVASTALALLFAGLATTLSTMIKNQQRGNAIVDLKQEAEFGVQSVERLVTSGREVVETSPFNCSSSMTELAIQDTQSNQLVFRCETNQTITQTTNTQAPIVLVNQSNQYTLSNCRFSCYKDIYRQFQEYSIDFEFSLSSGSQTESFSISTVLRN